MKKIFWHVTHTNQGCNEPEEVPPEETEKQLDALWAEQEKVAAGFTERYTKTVDDAKENGSFMKDKFSQVLKNVCSGIDKEERAQYTQYKNKFGVIDNQIQGKHKEDKIHVDGWRKNPTRYFWGWLAR